MMRNETMDSENGPSDSKNGDDKTQVMPLLGGADRLKQIAEQLESTGQPAEPVTPRELLRWFGAYRRGPLIVKNIRAALYDAKLATKPDFEGAWVDGLIELVRQGEVPPPETPESLSNANISGPAVGQITADPTYRIGKLRSANTPPISVKPQQKITEAVTIMMANDFSQLPVMENEYKVNGIISWTTIGSRLALGVGCSEVRECMVKAHEISADTSLFDAINEIVTNQYVLIRDSTNKISGIVTTSDLSLQFRQLAEPFLLLGEIENHIRGIIEKGKFTKAELQSSCDPDTDRTVNGAYDLNFGEYIRLLEDPKRWSQLNLKIDRKIFIVGLDKVRQIRNEVMHFDPDGVSDEELNSLRGFTGFLQRLQSVLPER
jgi:CBS domain-containing protein